MAETVFLVERYIPALNRSELEALARRLLAATAALRAEGRDVRWLRSLALPDDETCICVFAADHAEDISEANRRASIGYERIVPAIAVDNDFDGD
jgi:hypothetical protein